MRTTRILAAAVIVAGLERTPAGSGAGHQAHRSSRNDLSVPGREAIQVLVGSPRG
jgi:hypothetical protein